MKLRGSLALASCLAASAAMGGGVFGFDPVARPEAAASMYLVPENLLVYRMRQADGLIRQFERRFDGDQTVLKSVGGWGGSIRGEEGTVWHETPDGRQDAAFVFRKGRLKSFDCEGVKKTFPEEGSLPRLSSPVPPLHGSMVDVERRKAEAERLRAKKTIWMGSGRLQFPFQNPNRNGMLYALLTLTALGLLSVRRRRVHVTAVVCATVFGALLLMTGSRSSFLGFALGVLPLGVLHFKAIVRSKAFYSILSVLVVFGAVWFGFHDTKSLSRGLKKTSWSGKIRLELWNAAPRMMADAPGGWGFMQSGHAYVNWYQPMAAAALPGSMMNDHLTALVKVGRTLRFTYLFGWVLLLLLTAVLAVLRRMAYPLGTFAVLAVGGWFNPVLEAWPLWVFPALGAAMAVRSFPWRRWKLLCGIVALAAVVAWSGLASLERRAVAFAGQSPSIQVDESQVMVNGAQPFIWLVDDGFSLGGALSGKDIRLFYAAHPNAPSIGWVRKVEDLPSRPYGRLVLAGASGDAWLKKLMSDVAARANLPEEVVFLSPPFPPQAIPQALFGSCRVKVVVGEFAAAYHEEYANAQPWVELARGAELYIPNWMTHVVGR